MPSRGFLADVRQRGRRLTVAALGPNSIDAQRERVAAMTPGDLVGHAIAKLDALLDDFERSEKFDAEP
jgi:hypothetical protein